MGDVKHYKGSLARYNELQEKDPDGLYFITDEGMIFKGDTPVATTRNACYGTCSTASGTAEKVCAVSPFPVDSNGKPLVGTVIAVKFSNTTTATNPRLNVNGTGAAAIWYNASQVTTNTSVVAYAGRVIYYLWDGTYWVWMGWSYDSNTTYSVMTQAEMNEGTSTGARLLSPKLVKNNFDIDNNNRTVKVRGLTIGVPEDLEWETF